MVEKLLITTLLTLSTFFINGNEVARITHSYVQNVAIYDSTTETITDEDGEVFGVYAPDIPNNSTVWVTYDTMGTPTRIDDEIVDMEIID